MLMTKSQSPAAQADFPLIISGVKVSSESVSALALKF